VLLTPITLATVLQWLGGTSHAVQRTAVCSSGELATAAHMALKLDKIASLEQASASHLSFLSNAKYRTQLGATAAGAVLLREADLASLPEGCVGIVTPDPYLDYALLAQRWQAFSSGATAASADSSALFAKDISKLLSVSIHSSAIISEATIIADGVTVGALCFVGKGVKIGEGTVLHPRVTVLDDCEIGARCIVHSGAVIGADGFGFAPTPGKTWEKIPQLGRVIIGDDCEIGANTTIDRGALNDTVLEQGVKLDNQVQIAHGVRVGQHTAIAGCAGVAGSAVIGAHCTVGGGAVILGHLSLCDGVHVSAATVVTRSITKPGQYTGFFPFDDNRAWEKNAAALKQLAELRERIKQLESKP
jgi:UDP-3-O-[3-hydroxymyristoyl] glucosamine N-acyltransferase